MIVLVLALIVPLVLLMLILAWAVIAVGIGLGSGVRWWPAWFRALVASTGGYFWIPCPACGRMFAGYEWVSENTSYPYPDEPWRGTAVCSAECVPPQPDWVPKGARLIGWRP